MTTLPVSAPAEPITFTSPKKVPNAEPSVPKEVPTFLIFSIKERLASLTLLKSASTLSNASSTFAH